MSPTIGRIVDYVLSEQDAEQINRRRTDGASIAARMKIAVSEAPTDSQIRAWPAGAQAHIGSSVYAGLMFPAIVVAEKADAPSGETVAINLQVFLDGNDCVWVQDAKEDQNFQKQTGSTPGTWHWPARE